MAKLLSIRINGTEADLFSPEETKLAITKAIAEVTDLDKGRSDTTKTLELPLTDRNRALFGFPADLNSVGDIDQTDKPAIVIELEGSEFIRGFAKVTDVVAKPLAGSKFGRIKLVAIGTNGDWKTALNELGLRDLDFTDNDHIWNKANVDASEVLDPSRAYVYPLINYGKMLGGTVGDEVEVGDRFPATRVDEIVKRMFKAQGYKVTGNWISNEAASMLVPFTNDRLRQPEGFDTDREYRAGLSINKTFVGGDLNTGDVQLAFDLDSGGSLFDNGGNYDTTLFKYVAPDAISSTFTIEGEFDCNHVLQVEFKLKVNGVTVASDIKTVSGLTSSPVTSSVLRTSLFQSMAALDEATVDVNVSNAYGTRFAPSWSIPAPSTVRVFSSVNHFLEVGDSVGITFSFPPAPDGVYPVTAIISPTTFEVDISPSTYSGPISGVINYGKVVPAGTIFTLKSANSFFYNNVNAAVNVGDTVRLAGSLPDESQLETLQGFKAVDNLYIDTDTRSREVLIEPRDDYYTDEVIDLTQLVDVSREMEIEYIGDKLEKKIQHRYQEDSNDKYVAQFQEDNETILGAATQELANQFAKDGTKEKKVPIFAPTFMGTAPEIGLNATKIPRLWQSAVAVPARKTAFTPRLLHYEGVLATRLGDSWIWEGGTRTDFPSAYSIDTDNDNDNSLYFNETRRSNGLLKKRYRNTYRVIDESRIVTFWLNLNDAFINNLSFRPKYRIDINGEPVFFRLNAVKEYRPFMDVVTRCEFFREVDLAPLPPVTTVLDDSSEEVAEEAAAAPEVAFGSHGIRLLTGDRFNTGREGFSIAREVPTTGGQIAFGQYGLADEDAALIIGGGTISSRKNVLKIMNDGRLVVGEGGSQLYTTNNDGGLVPLYYIDQNDLKPKPLKVGP